MRAFAVQQFGSAPGLIDLPAPSDPSAVLFRMTVVGVNPVDYKLVDQLKPDSKFPFVVGIDFSGRVERVPSGETSVRVGDRVFGSARTSGAYAEFAAIVPGAKAEPFAPIPEGVTDEQAAALPIPGVTALRSTELLEVGSGRTLVVFGATGAVGGYALQIARSHDAHVIAVVQGNGDEARRLGAHEVFDAKAGDPIAAIRAAHPNGVDAVLDIVNTKDKIGRDAEILSPGGRLVSTVYAADEDFFKARQITATNISSMTNPLSTADGLSRLAQLLQAGTITARIGTTFALDDAATMIEQLRGGKLQAKTLLRP